MVDGARRYPPHDGCGRGRRARLCSELGSGLGLGLGLRLGLGLGLGREGIDRGEAEELLQQVRVGTHLVGRE